MNIDSIQNGVVLDHIQAGKSMDIYRYLHLAQHQRDGGEHQHEHQCFAGEVPVDFFPGQQDQRQVDEQGEVADIDVQQVLQHGGQAVDARRGEGVGKDKQLIADAHQAGQTGCDRVAAQSGPRGMMLHRSASVF